jgi:hypothetical protein
MGKKITDLQAQVLVDAKRTKEILVDTVIPLDAIVATHGFRLRDKEESLLAFGTPGVIQAMIEKWRNAGTV